MSTYIPSIFNTDDGSDLSSATEAPRHYQVGSVIYSQYLVKELLPGGTLGKTYRCRSLTTDNEVVLKSINSEGFADVKSHNLLLSEIQNWMRLPRCPNLVSIADTFYDVSTQATFFCMPYITGNPAYGLSLDEWYGRYQFTELDLFYTALCICKAFKDCLSKTGTLPVHGDIKPSNILLEDVGKRFPEHPFLSCNLRLADCGAIGYTPLYYPPAYASNGLNPDAASDVYALFTVLREMEKYTTPSYSPDCPMHGLIEMMLTYDQWKIYDLPTIYDDFLMMIMEHQYGGEVEQLLYMPPANRARDIFYRVQDIRANAQMFYKDDSGLNEIAVLREEADRNEYVINGIPLIHYIDRHYFTAAALCGDYELSECILTRYERDYMALSDSQRQQLKGCYSLSVSDEFKILHAYNLFHLGSVQDAISLYHDVALDQCICFDWVESYIELLFPLHDQEGVNEAQYLGNKLSIFLSTHEADLPKDHVAYLKCCLGTVLGYLGEYDRSLELLDECVTSYPHNLEYLFQYGYALMLSGDISRARYPLHMLYYGCCKIEARSPGESGLVTFHAQSLSYYKYWAALMLGDFPAALKYYDEYRKNSSFYSGKPTDPGNAIGGFINSSYDNYKYFLSVSDQMSNEDYLLTYKAQFKEWHDCLALPLNHNYIIMKRGEFQVFLNVHTRCCDIASAVGAWDYLIELCEDMLTLRRESSNILKYLGRAYAGKGDLTKAAQFYVEAAAMVSIEYPRYPQNGDDSRPAKEIKNELRQEMRSMGLDPNLIN